MHARIGPDGVLAAPGWRLRAAIGRSGVTGNKREGDGATPLGLLALRRVLFRADRLAAPRPAVPCGALAEGDGWCDDPDHPAYNQPIHLPHHARHERLWRTDGLYDLVGVLGWNDAPVVPGHGSAIFLHVAAPDYAPTAGCIGLALADMTRLLDAGLTTITVTAAPCA